MSQTQKVQNNSLTSTETDRPIPSHRSDTGGACSRGCEFANPSHDQISQNYAFIQLTKYLSKSIPQEYFTRHPLFNCIKNATWLTKIFLNITQHIASELFIHFK